MKSKTYTVHLTALPTNYWGASTPAQAAMFFAACDRLLRASGAATVQIAVSWKSLDHAHSGTVRVSRFRGRVRAYWSGEMFADSRAMFGPRYTIGAWSAGVETAAAQCEAARGIGELRIAKQEAA